MLWNVEVAAGIPRLRIAFQLILNDETMKQQTERVKKNLLKKELKEDKKDLVEDLERLLTRKRDLVEEERKLAENLDHFLRLFGEQEVQSKKLSLLQQLQKIQTDINEKEKEISDIETKLE